MMTQKELNKLVCSCNKPDCKNESLHLRPACCGVEPLNVVYNKEGILIFSCPVCNRHVCTIVVAKEN